MEEETVRSMPETRLKLTIEDYELFLDDGQRHELIDGEHVVTPSPSVRHQRILRRLLVAFDAASRASEGGEVFFAPLDVAPDGERFLFAMPTGEQASAPIRVVVNWRAELGR
jgi:Uma2 family endonuclease